MSTVYDLVKRNFTDLKLLARSGVEIEEVNNIDIYEKFTKLQQDGLKTTYIVAFLCDEYAVSERTIWRIIQKFRRSVNQY